MVSVIIPVYNAEKFLYDSVNSIIQQSYPDLEILICDDCSRDGSLKLLQQFDDNRIKLFTNQSNLGYLRTINRLMGLAEGEFVAFHDADDISHLRRIQVQVEFMRDNRSIDLVGTNFNVIDEHGREIQKASTQVADADMIRELLVERNLFQKPSILFRREIFRHIGGFREAFLKLKNISEDYDWLLRASEKFKLSNVNAPFPLYSYRSVGTAMSKHYNHVEQHIGAEVTQFLARERRAHDGQDSLSLENWDVLYGKIETLKKPYLKDRSLLFHEKAESLMYDGLLKQACTTALYAVFRAPYKYRNVKTLLSCLKRIVKKRLE